MSDREQIRKLTSAVEEAVQGIGDRYGLTVKVGGATYSEHNCTVKVTFAVKNANGEVMTPEAEHFRAYACRYGLRPDDLFREFADTYGSRYKIVGAKPRSRKYPILARSLSGEQLFKFPASLVKAGLERESAA